MKTLIDNMIERGEEPQVNHYLVVFLKVFLAFLKRQFLQTVIPTIDYDFTADA